MHTDVSIGRDISFAEIENQYDAVYISIGAHNDKKIGIPGEDAVGVHSAVQLLRDIGEGRVPDFKGKRVCVIGGGNVSMDATRTAIRLGASAVTCVYRRRVTDMTALAEEIEEAQSEGCQILSLQAPDHIETDETGRVTALWTRPQVIGAYGKDGRPRPYDADPPHTVRCRYRSHRPVHRRKAVRADRSGRARQDSGRIRRICAEHPACIRGRRCRYRSGDRYPRGSRRQGGCGQH